MTDATPMANGRILLARSGGVAVMTLNDPPVLNAFGVKLRQDMTQALDAIEASDARCLVITGAGNAFCSGANLNDKDRAPRDRQAEARGEVKTDLELWYNPTFQRLRGFPIPIVTAINGIAAGAGMSLALSGDFKIAARSASFLQAFARIGLVPDAGSSYILPRLIGQARALELSLLAERLPAETALQWGMINRLVEDAELMPRALEMAQRLASGPKSLGLIRQMYWDSLENSYAEQLATEGRMQMIAGLSEDYAEGVAAFREKRPAAFKGR
ncbi:MAG: enoyl-CoA hydratase-related protein [Acetobacteraceae bacterium]